MAVTDLSIGWDVGAWHCTGKSQDALTVLSITQDMPALVGQPWRGNLRELLLTPSADELFPAFLKKCGVLGNRTTSVIVSIDTPLGWPSSLIGLLATGVTASVPSVSSQNPYLYRQTERFLASRGKQPLSVVKDMIGSQSTKGLHFLNSLNARTERVGVWISRAGNLKVICIEAYPAPAKNSPWLKSEFERLTGMDSWVEQVASRGSSYRDDVQDSLWCALVGWAFVRQPERLIPPQAEVSADEGWIWIPRDAFT